MIAMDVRIFTLLALLSGIQAAKWVALNNWNGKAVLPESAILAGHLRGDIGIYVGR